MFRIDKKISEKLSITLAKNPTRVILMGILLLNIVIIATSAMIISALAPDEILPGSTKRVWWRCTDGHEWKAAVYSRTGAKKCGCPVCAGKPPRQYP